LNASIVPSTTISATGTLSFTGPFSINVYT
jgi:hypothetical protein